jgi:hypothetical protein
MRSATDMCSADMSGADMSGGGRIVPKALEVGPQLSQT